MATLQIIGINTATGQQTISNSSDKIIGIPTNSNITNLMA